MNDLVNSPQHYTSSPAKCKLCSEPIECIDVTQHMNFNVGNSIKYLWRAGKKSTETTIQDLEKAAKYIQFEIDRLERNAQTSHNP